MKVIVILLMSSLLFACTKESQSQVSRNQRIQASAQWSENKFQNITPVPSPGFKEIVSMGWGFFFEKPPGGSAEKLLPADKIDVSTWPKNSQFQFAWLGHTTFLLAVEGKWIITDPIFSQRAGSFGWLSPARYSELPVKIENLPPLDVVLITHDHYDHLDETSIKALISKTRYFICPLAVGALLEKWGVPEEKLIELDWWEEKNIDNIKITSTPARHFSGRGLFDRDKTLWSSYAIQGKKTNLYLSGDSGWHDQLHEIGERLGPFDVTFFEMGAYGEPAGWKEVHCTPEEAVKAHKAVKGKLLIPSHWATFDLAMFKWYEPIERFVIAAVGSGIDFRTPRPGERINPSHHGGNEKWWRRFIENDL